MTDTKVITKKRAYGASLVEYALLVSLIAVVVLGALRTYGRNLSTKYSEIHSGVSS